MSKLHDAMQKCLEEAGAVPSLYISDAHLQADYEHFRQTLTWPKEFFFPDNVVCRYVDPPLRFMDDDASGVAVLLNTNAGHEAVAQGIEPGIYINSKLRGFRGESRVALVHEMVHAGSGLSHTLAEDGLFQAYKRRVWLDNFDQLASHL
jgi:hypothetical protein